MLGFQTKIARTEILLQYGAYFDHVKLNGANK